MPVSTIVSFPPISKGDEQTVKTIAFMAKFKNKVDHLRAALVRQYEKNPKEINNALPYGLFNLFAYNAEDALESKVNFECAIETFNDILKERPDYWLVRICRMRLLFMLPSDHRNSLEMIEELEWIIEGQKNSNYEAYHIVPYILLAELYLVIGDCETAKKYIDKAESLEKKPILMLADFFVITVKDFERNLRLSRLTDSADKVATLRREFFNI